MLEDPWTAPPADVYQWTVYPAAAPGRAGRGDHHLRRRPCRSPWTASATRTRSASHRRSLRAWWQARASAASTTSKTVWSASRAARSTRRRPQSSCTPPHPRARGHDPDEAAAPLRTAGGDELSELTYDGLWFSALHRDLREYVPHDTASRERRGPAAAGPRDRWPSSAGGATTPSTIEALATYEGGRPLRRVSAIGFIKHLRPAPGHRGPCARAPPGRGPSRSSTSCR